MVNHKYQGWSCSMLIEDLITIPVGVISRVFMFQDLVCFFLVFVCSSDRCFNYRYHPGPLTIVSDGQRIFIFVVMLFILFVTVVQVFYCLVCSKP